MGILLWEEFGSFMITRYLYQFMKSSSQVLAYCIVMSTLMSSFFMSVVYASNMETPRRLWHEFRELQSFTPDIHWITIGNFNGTMQGKSHYYLRMHIPSAIQEFKSFLKEARLVDLHS